MDNNEWALQELDQLIAKTSSFTDRATLIATKKLVQEQAKRIQQAEDELDGRIWSPNKW